MLLDCFCFIDVVDLLVRSWFVGLVGFVDLVGFVCLAGSLIVLAFLL